MKIGVLALQGNFAAHQNCLAHNDVASQQVRKPSDLDGLDGIVLPGGESSVMSRLLLKFGLFEVLKEKIQQGLPTFATCAGLILLAQDCEPKIPQQLALLPLSVDRNGYGPQVESSWGQLEIPQIATEPLEVHFIRAPIISRCESGVIVLSSWKEKPVLVAQNRILAMTFHPELDPKTPFYPFWLENFVKNFKNVEALTTLSTK